METLDYLKPSLQNRQKRRDKRMGRIATEGYRGVTWRDRKGYKKKELQSTSESAPNREGIRPKFGQLKYSSLNLNPLKRFLVSHIGKNWDKIYSELCRKYDQNTVTGKRVMDCLHYFVHLNTVKLGNKVYEPSNQGMVELYSTEYRPAFYISDKNGTLMKVRNTKTKTGYRQGTN